MRTVYNYCADSKTEIAINSILNEKEINHSFIERICKLINCYYTKTQFLNKTHVSTETYIGLSVLTNIIRYNSSNKSTDNVIQIQENNHSNIIECICINYIIWKYIMK